MKRTILAFCAFAIWLAADSRSSADPSLAPVTIWPDPDGRLYLRSQGIEPVQYSAPATIAPAAPQPNPFVSTTPALGQPALTAPVAAAPFDPYGPQPVPVAALPDFWFVSADIQYLRLNRPQQQTVAIDQNTLAPVLTTGDLEFELQPGLRAAIGRQFNNVFTAEAVYFGLNRWSDMQSSRGANNNLRLPGDLGLALADFFGADVMSEFYLARLNNAEFNGWYNFNERFFSVMAGFRYVQLVEKFTINAIDSDGDSSDYQVRARNNLFGGQIGAQLSGKLGDLELAVVGKAGVYDNEAEQTTTLFDNNNQFPIRNSMTTGSHLAFVGDLAINGRVRLADSLFLEGGYFLMWMTDLARAPEQLDFTDTPTSGTALVSNSSAFLHGANLGLEARW
jgi:Putative beta barrel porin-7 (BBP7)